MTYEDLVNQMNSSMLAGHDDRVTLLKEVLATIGHPDLKYKIIHLAGTNGKGSTGTMTADLLNQQGYQVGHFASPAMVDLREQIQINGRMISKNEFVKVYEFINRKLPQDIKSNDLTVFEWFTLIMLQYFADQHVDWAVIEAGLGGLTDSTNAIEPPLLTIFTHIDLDHTNILGNTIKLIAYNKSQIIKKGTTVFVAPHQDDAAMTILKNTSVENGAAELDLPDSIKIDVNHENLSGFDLTVNSKTLNEHLFHFNLLGDFQLDNLTTVIMVYDWLIDHQMIEDWHPLAKMMNTISIPGRMQQLTKRPPVFLDGAHNPDGTRQLMRSMGHLFFDYHWIFVVGFLKDKNYLEMARLYRKYGAKIFLTKPDNPERALPEEELHNLLPDAAMVYDARDGLQQALVASDDHSVIVVTGSFYLIKELEQSNES
ncbi:folylpolyglutamate synthase/dihydrofolate synthase family protein [Paucilactobacillus suebicus]|uniref:tetrahydrofolate synthase n=1 Tax=Paucilactobacillus suebicus DSM 5007 = KCTC 3549 TaxID=1423807 RepID=A0A0R1VZU0_9LACO|nr:folylpolyglutamate synthase/dihydrofolate synthase family protein [Paucilactobacillus suebicus]KRM10885.1 folylpolyglutamate synthase [Paucilactobacillus suebicus DSM 5007 = KCTC 3549]